MTLTYYQASTTVSLSKQLVVYYIASIGNIFLIPVVESLGTDWIGLRDGVAGVEPGQRASSTSRRRTWYEMKADNQLANFAEYLYLLGYTQEFVVRCVCTFTELQYVLPMSGQ